MTVSNKDPKEVCKYCGSKEGLDKIKERGFISCCPEREMIPVFKEQTK